MQATGVNELILIKLSHVGGQSIKDNRETRSDLYNKKMENEKSYETDNFLLDFGYIKKQFSNLSSESLTKCNDQTGSLK